MSVLITGANGFLGHYLTGLLLKKGYDVIATGMGGCRLPFSDEPGFRYEAMDFTDPSAVTSVFEKYTPTVVVHSGARSKPDECELNQPMAYNCNVKGTRNLLEASAGAGSFYIFVSTDFIFDGEKGMYREEDEPNPVNYYGTTKLLAEKEVQGYINDWAIARTVMVYGKSLSGRTNLLTLVKEKLEKGEEYRVVNDQVRTPTYVEDLAAGIAAIIEKRATGIFHLSGTDILTPYEMATRTAEYLGLDQTLLKKVTAADFKEPARRPLKTGFITDKAKKWLGYNPVSFEEGLQKTFSDQK